MKKIIVFALILFSTSFSKAGEIKIPDCSEPLNAIKFSSNEENSVALSNDGRIFVSGDQCHSWSDVLRVSFIEKLTDVEIVTDKIILAVGENGLAARTTDGGGTWNIILGLPEKDFTKVKFVNQYLFILGETGTVLRSNDYGESFQNYSVNTTGSFRDITFKKSTDLGFLVSDQEPGLWYSLYGGTSWESYNLPQEATGNSICIDGQILYIAGLGYLGFEHQSPCLLRINSADLSDWMVAPLPESYNPTGVIVKSGKGAAIMNKAVGEIWRASSNGMSWSSQSINRMLYSIAMRGDALYIASDSGTILQLDVVTGISGVNSEVPNGYALSQNYPNPFNPSTKISFSIPQSGSVKLTVYNTAGKEVAVLINQHLNIGNYIKDFDATNLTSGVYFYTLQTDRYIDTKKMVLLK